MAEENKLKKIKNAWGSLLIKMLFDYVLFVIGIFWLGESDVLRYLIVIAPLVIFSLNFFIAKDENEYKYLNGSVIVPAFIYLLSLISGDVNAYYNKLVLWIFLFICFEYLILEIVLYKIRKRIKINFKFNITKIIVYILVCIVIIGAFLLVAQSKMGIEILWYVVDESSTEARAREITLKVNSPSTIDWGDGIKEDITAIGNISELNHIYDKAGKYRVIIHGKDIEYLDCSSSNVIELDTTTSPDLETIICENNDINSLKVSANNPLKKLLFLSNKLKRIFCANNNLTSLDISNNRSLVEIDCKNNNLINLDISKNKSLERLECNNNNLTSLNIENNSALGYLYCRNNNLISLNIKNNLFLRINDGNLSYDENVSIIR